MRQWMLDSTHSHTPPQRELFFALSGTTVSMLGKEIYPIKPGTVMLFDHYETHGLDPVPGEHSIRHLWFHLPSRDQMSTNIFSVDSAGAPSDLAMKVRFDPFVQLIYDAWSDCVAQPHSATSRTLCKSVLTTAFLETLGRPARQPAEEIEKNVVDYIVSYIDKHLAEPLTLTRLAKLAGYNPFSFHRIFKQQKKTTLHRFIMLKRVTEARRLLLQGYSVESVAEAVGMSSPAVFSRFFKTQAELSPSSWRKMNKYEIE